MGLAASIAFFDGTTRVFAEQTVGAPPPREDDNPFQTVPSTHVVGPTAFPKPTDIDNPQNLPLEPYLKPISGKHRPDEDAILLL